MQDMICRVANILTYNVSSEDTFADKVSIVRDLLLSEGMSEYDIFLTYVAGKMLYEDRRKHML